VLEVNDAQYGVGSQSRVCTVTLIAPAPQPVAPLPVALQSPRQLAGIPHANPAAPPLVGMGRVNGVSLFRYASKLICSLRSKN